MDDIHGINICISQPVKGDFKVLNHLVVVKYFRCIWFNTVEYQMRHMRRLFGALQSRGATTFEVTDDASKRSLQDVQQRLESSVFVLGDCASSRSYWFSPSGEPALFRPTSVRNAVRAQDRFPLSDYAIS